MNGARTAGVGLLCFILGVMVTLALRPAPKEPPPPVCPPPVACPSCPSCLPAPATARRPPGSAPRRPAPLVQAPLPDLPFDEEAHRDRLRSWFEANADKLVDCVQKGDPRRRILLEIHVEADGAIPTVQLLGAADLSPETVACVRKRVTALKAPREMLRGRETLVIYLNL